MSAFGTKRTCQSLSAMSALGGKATLRPSRLRAMKRGDNRETAGGVAEYLAARPRQPKSDLIDSIRTRPVPGSPTEPRAPAGISSWDGVGVNVAAFAAAKNIRGINMIKKSIFALATTALTVGFTAVAAEAADIFTLESTTFADGKIMPKKVANSKAMSAARAPKG